MSPHGTQKTTLRRSHFRSLRGAIAAIAGALVLTIALQADATPVTGDQFTMIFSETSPSNLPDAASGIVTLGLPDGPGFFHVSNVSVIVGGSNCFTCGLLTEDLTNLLFDAATLDLTGKITGTFLGANGGTHTFEIDVTDASTTTWSYTNTRPDGIQSFANGTYTTERTVDEPPAVLMLGLGLAGLFWLLSERTSRFTHGLR